MEKEFFSGVRLITAVATIILIFAVLLMPEPKYYKHKTCPEYTPLSENEKCGDNVIEWGPSIAQRLRAEYLKRQGSSEILTIPPTSPTVTENWIIYKNNKHDFQFKHPKYLYIVNEGQDRFSYVLSMSMAEEIEMVDAFELNLVIATNEESINNLKFCIENAGKIKEGPAYNYEGEKLMLKNDLIKIGRQETCMQEMNIDEKKVYNVLLQRGDDIYTVQFLTEGDENIADTLVKQILSTFTFIGSE